MPWFKVDDAFHSHPKAMSAGNAALGLWVVAGSWSSANLTDGFVPDYVLPRLVSSEANGEASASVLASRLVEANLWRQVRGGYRFHDWDHFQPSAGEEKEKRRKRSEAGRKGGLASGKTRSKPRSNDEAFASPSVEAKTNPEPEPVPSTSPNGEVRETSEIAERSRPDVDELCGRLRDRVYGNGAKRPTVTKKWRTEARLLLDRDGRDHDQALRLIDWATSHHFWASNILSMPKFREKYDQLLMQAKREHQQQAPKPHPTDVAVARLLSGNTPTLRALPGGEAS